MPADALIRDVSDTAIWVAQYRAEESGRPDAMFRDPLAKLLVGERGPQIARDFGKADARYFAYLLAGTIAHAAEFEQLLAPALDRKPSELSPVERAILLLAVGWLLARLLRSIVRDVVDIAKCAEKSVSVSIEEVHPDDWTEKVYKPDILNSANTLYKKPGYNPLQ